MKPPKAGYGKNHAVQWTNVGNDETMYSGAMTKEEAERILNSGHWHRHAAPVVVSLIEIGPEKAGSK